MMLDFTLLKSFAKGKLFATSLLSASFVGLFATTSLAGNPTGTITKDNFSIDEGVGNTIILDRVVTINLENLVETITETVTEAPEEVDILFLADNTGSMGEEIANVQTNAQDILNDLRAAYADTTDIQFGVARYYGAPKEYGHYYYQCGWSWCLNTSNDSVPGDTYEGTVEVVSKTFTYLNESGWRSGVFKYKYKMEKKDASGTVVEVKNVWRKNANLDGFTKYLEEPEVVSIDIPVEMGSYELQVAIGGTDAEITEAIGTTSSYDNDYSWHAQGGKDWPEANFFALHQAATSGAATNLGWQTGYDTNWRDNAMKIIVWFGDAYSHSSDTTEAEAITALNNNNIYVVAVNVGTGNSTLNKNSQATNITTATSGQYASSTANNVANTMETLIGTAVDSYTVTTETITSPIINIDFRTSDDTPIPQGLTVTYACTDPHPDGCNNVSNGESRTFQMIVEGNNAGNYTFKTEVFDVETSNDVVDADNQIIFHNID